MAVTQNQYICPPIGGEVSPRFCVKAIVVLPLLILGNNQSIRQIRFLKAVLELGNFGVPGKKGARNA